MCSKYIKFAYLWAFLFSKNFWVTYFRIHAERRWETSERIYSYEVEYRMKKEAKKKDGEIEQVTGRLNCLHDFFRVYRALTEQLQIQQITQNAACRMI
jgi:hypothetical protein